MLADLERDLIDQTRGLLDHFGWSATVYGDVIPGSYPEATYTPNPDLAGPLGMAYRRVVGPPASGLRPAVDEYEALTATQGGKLGEWALYRLLQKFRDNLADVDERTLDAEAKYSQLRDSLDRRIEYLGKRLGDDGRQPLSGFSIPLANVATDDSGEWCP